MKNLGEFNALIKKLRIFVPSPTIYGAISGFHEFGPYGTSIKKNIVNLIKKEFSSFGFWEVEHPLIMPAVVWKASGHLDSFNDIIADSDGKIYRIDKIVEEQYPEILIDGRGLEALSTLIENNKIIPKGNKEPLHNPRKYSLMMNVKLGEHEAYLRPETATATYLSFKDYYILFRERIPIKVFQFGKAFRNEVSSRQGLIREREFEQLEGQIFILKEQKQSYIDFHEIKDKKSLFLDYKRQLEGGQSQLISIEETVNKGIIKNQGYAYCFGLVLKILEELGIKKDTIRFRQHLPDEKAHYALDAWDTEVYTEKYGWLEICGVHDRGNYDLSRHQEFSGKTFSIRNQNNEEEIPSILEIAFGIGRIMYCILEHSYVIRDEKNVLKLPKNLPPMHCAVFPLVKKGGLEEIAKELHIL